MNHRWKSFIAMIVFSFTTAFFWMASIIWRVGGVAEPSQAVQIMQSDLESVGIIAFLFDLIILCLILNMIRPSNTDGHAQGVKEIRS